MTSITPRSTPRGTIALLPALLILSSGCSVLMAMSGTPAPDFAAFEIGSSRQLVELQLGTAKASEPLPDGTSRNTYEFEVGNSPNNHRALMNLYIDLATLGLYEIPGTFIEASMGEMKQTSIVYDKDDRVVSIEGYTPPPPSAEHQKSIDNQQKWRTSIEPTP